MTVSNRLLLFLAAFLLAAVMPRLACAAEAYAVVDAKTGHILDQRKGKNKRQIASLTKVATAIVVLDWAEKSGGDLNQVATIPPEAFSAGGDNLVGFQPGDTATLRDLLYAALVQSDNIGAYTLAHHVGQRLTEIAPNAGGPVATFVGQMNALAKALGMERTRFVNPTGADATARPRPYSTALDLARLTRYAMNKAAFRFYVSQKTRQIAFQRAGQQKQYELRNTNDLLGVEGIDGVKTGRTARAGDCLILSAQREAEVIRHSESRTTIIPRHLIVVLLASPNRFEEGRSLLQQGWQLYEQWVGAGRPTAPKTTL